MPIKHGQLSDSLAGTLRLNRHQRINPARPVSRPRSFHSERSASEDYEEGQGPTTCHPQA
jgi:hypothetical protein